MSDWYRSEGTSPPSPLPPQPPSGRTTNWLPAIIAGVWVVAAVSVLAAVFVIRSGGSDQKASPLPAPGTVRLEPVTYVSPAPFTTSVAMTDLDGLADRAIAVVSADLPAPTGSVAGDAAHLYVSTSAEPPCDKAALAERLRSDAQVGKAWASAAGVEPAGTDALLATLTPVILRADTAVTNHVYTGGEAEAYQSVLEAGTPVMVDPTGLPRVQCSCGNPLLAPEATRPAKTDGTRWKAFDATQVVAVTPAVAPVSSFITVDLDTSKPATTATGSNTVLDGTIVASTDGVHVATPDGQLVKVLDKQVDTVFDDGRGGIVYTLFEPGNEYHNEQPASAELSTIWHLPAGATEAVPILAPQQGGAWNVLEAVGSLGGRTYIVYGSMRMDPGSEGIEPTSVGSLVARDLDTGADTQLMDDAYGWEFGVTGVTFGGDRLAVSNAAEAYVGTMLFGPGPAAIQNRCGNDEMIEFDVSAAVMPCPTPGALDESGKVVGIDFAETTATPTVVWTDPLTGEKGRGVVLLGAFDPDGSLRPKQIRGDRLVWGSFDSGNVVWRMSRSSDGAPIDVPTGGQQVRQLWMLTAPLIRPGAEPTPTPTTVPSPYRPVTIDELRAGFPSAVCGVEAGSVPIGPDGNGESGTDPAHLDYVSVGFTDQAVITDVDGDGVEETVVAPMCSGGGSGYTTPVAAVRLGPNGIEIVGEVFDKEFGRTGRAIEHVRVADGGIEVSGAAWVMGDAACCGSSTFTARLRFVDGRWQEV